MFLLIWCTTLFKLFLVLKTFQSLKIASHLYMKFIINQCISLLVIISIPKIGFQYLLKTSSNR